MTDKCVFRCRIYHDVIGKHYISLARRAQRYGRRFLKGKSQTAVTNLESQEMFRYDSQDCRHLHRPQVVAELQLKTTFPSSATLVPCKRCGAQVDRTLPLISNSVVEMEIAETPKGLVGTVLDDKDLAVLRRNCEEPDEPSAEAASEFHHQQERTRA